MKEINIYVKTSFTNPKAKNGKGTYMLEYIHKGEPVTLDAVLAIENSSMQESYLATLIAGLGRLKEKCNIKVITSNKYLMDVLGNEQGRGWLYSWKESNWVTKRGTDVKHKEMLQELDGLISEKCNKIFASNEFNSYEKIMTTEVMK